MLRLKTTVFIVSIISLAIFFSRCNKNNDGITPDPIEISLPKSQLKASELALIEVNTQIEDQTNSIIGEIESESVEFLPNGRFFIFKVPSGTVGTKNGNINIDGEQFDFQYQLQSPSFNNPETYLQEYFADQQEVESQLSDLQIDFINDSIPGFQDIQSDVAIWNQIANDAQAELAALSSENKLKLAQLLDANREWIQHLEDALLLESIYSDNKSTKQQCKQLINQGRTESAEGRYFAAAATAVRAYWCSLTFEERQYEDLDNDFERGVLLLEDVELDPGFGVLNTITNQVFRKADGLMKELQGSISSNGIAEEIEELDYKMASEIPFGNGDPTPIFAKIRYRSINQNDVNNSGPIGEAAALFSQLMSSYNDMLEAVNRPLIWRPGFTQSSVTKNFNQFLAIPSASVSNSDVILVNTQYVDDKWEVVFGNDGNEEEPTFSFDLNYDDGYVQLEKNVSAKIVEGCANPNPCNGLTSISWGGYNYPLVEIGCQCWFEENLRYAGSIPEVTDHSVWIASGSNFGDTQEPAWCYYGNDPANEATYGKLYNWFAVNTGTLCPQGWHVPNDNDWNILTDYLGGSTDAGGKMKSISGWIEPNVDATNSSGFSGLPGGWRSTSSAFDEFYLQGEMGRWWSSSDGYYSHIAPFMELENTSTFANLDSWHKSTGASCRCVKD